VSFLLRIDSWIGTVPTTVTAQAPEFVSQPVREAEPCFIVSLEFYRGRSRGNQQRDNRLLLSHVGVVPKGSGRKSATAGRTFRALDITAIGKPLPLAECEASLTSATARALIGGVESRGGHLSREATSEIIGLLRRLRPQLAEALDRLEALNSGQRIVTGAAAERYAEDRDKFGVAARIFDAAVSQPWSRPVNDDDPYTVGLASVRIEGMEADAIAHDAGVIHGFYRMFENMPNTRQDLKVFHSRDNDPLTGRPREMQTLNVNATGIEAATGGDLLYYHLKSQSCVIVQYKRLEGRGTRYRIDDRLRDQLDRMTSVNGANKPATYLDDWRLGPDSCYLKLIEPQGRVDPDDTGMIDGRYLPLSYVQTLLGYTTGEQVIPTDSIRHLTNTLFITLVREGWIGTVGVEVDELMNYCKQQVKERRVSMLLAVDTSNETPHEQIARTRRRGR
jgi:hypothetical protein